MENRIFIFESERFVSMSVCVYRLEKRGNQYLHDMVEKTVFITKEI